LYFRLLPQDKNVCGPDVVDFLRGLKRYLPRPLTVIWDRGNVHDRSKVVRRHLAKHPEIVTEQFPGYAPELNPDEQVWRQTKHGRLANFAPHDIHALRRRLHYELRRLRKLPKLLAAFIRFSKLPLKL
jgi:transposase